MTFAVERSWIGDPDPMYVERWSRPEVQSRTTAPRQVVLVHGGAHTGTCWTHRPDGRPGWAQHLAALGWTVFVVDWPGTGRSGRQPGFLEAGAEPVVGALCQLLRETGPAVVIGHSMGAAIAAKVVERAGGLVTAFLAVAPAPPGNVPTDRPPAPADQPVVFSPELARRVFANSDRFPRAHVDAYVDSLVDCSPTITNALGRRGGLDALVIQDVAGVRACPSVVVVGEQDLVTPPDTTRLVADFLAARHLSAGVDCDLWGFGHLIPIEDGSERLLDAALALLSLSGTA